MAQNLNSLLNPSSVAVVGISQPDRFGGMIYHNLKAFNFPGQIYAVNPRYDSIYGQPCYASINDLPQRPDCALLAVPNHLLLDAMRETAANGIPSAVIFGSGFGEGENGRSLQESLAHIAREHNIAVCGPNCMGLIAFPSQFPVSGYPALTGMAPGHIFLVSHSGSIWESMIQNNRDVTYNYAISAGNEMVTTVADYIFFALEQPSTRVIGLFLETVRDPAQFRLALAKAAEKDIPVVVLKVGRSERGAKLAQAHSGALAGADAVYDALFAYYGVSRVQSPDEFMDTLELMATGYRPPTRFLSAVLDSGGERALLVDTAEAYNVPFADLADSTKTKIAAVLEPGLTIENPLDAWGTGNDSGQIYQTAALALDANPQTGLTLFAVDMMRGSIMPPTYPQIVLPIRDQFTKPLAFLVNISAAAGEDQLAHLRRAGVPVMMGTETGLRAIGHVLNYAEFHRNRLLKQEVLVSESVSDERSRPSHEKAPSPTPSPLDEHAGKQLLAGYGIPVTAESLAATLDEALAAAESIGYPVVLKTALPGQLHKSEVQGIHLNLAGPDQLTKAYLDLSQRLGSRVLVQEMVTGDLELILGLVNDPQFGHLLLIGLGGIFVELFQDSKLLLLPTTEQAVRQALLNLRSAHLLQGIRGRPALNIDGIVNTAMKLAQIAADFGEKLSEVDINPLIVKQNGVVAVDALIIFNQS